MRRLRENAIWAALACFAIAALAILWRSTSTPTSVLEERTPAGIVSSKPEWLQALVDTNKGARVEVDAAGRVREIVLLDVELSAEDLSRVAEFHELEVLYLSSCDVSDSDVERLGSFSDIRILGLDSNPIGDAALAFLVELRSVQVLDIRNTNVTDHGCAQLGQMLQLRELRLSNTSVTDRCVPALASLRELEEVWIDGTGITESGASELRDELPGCRVLSER